MQQQKDACGVRERVCHQELRVRTRRAEFDCGVGDRHQACRQSCIEGVVALPADTVRAHAATEQIKTKVEITRIFRIEVEESERRGLQPCSRRSRAGDRLVDAIFEHRERPSQQLRVKRLLRVEMELERGRRVARLGRNRAEACAFQALSLEDAAGGVENEAALEVRDCAFSFRYDGGSYRRCLACGEI